MKKPLLSFWSFEGDEQGVGNRDLLDQSLTAFFASRQCPGTAIRAAMDWTVEQARTRNPVISGFHSPLEQSVLEVLLTAKSPCVMVVARKLNGAKLPAAWLQAAEEGTAAVIGMTSTSQQLTAELAARRNDWIAQCAARIVVAYAADGGVLATQMLKWKNIGLDIECLG